MKQNQLPVFRKTLALPSLASVLAAIAIVASGCGKGQQAMMPPPPTVTIAPVEQKELVEWQEFTGRTAPVESVEIRSKVSGYIQEQRFQSGQLVKKGDVLFVIDPRWIRADYEKSQADADRAAAQAANAKRDADRARALLESKTISPEEADAKSSSYEAAKAALASAEAARDAAKLDLDYTQVRSPVDGRVSRELVTPGNYINGAGGPAASTLLTTVVSVDPVYVYADVDEDSLLRFNSLVQTKKIETGGDGKIPVDLQLADETDFEHHGFIESFDNKLDPNTGSITLRTVFPNPDGKIVPGLFARIRLPLSEKYNALMISERAVGTDQAQKFVLGVTDSNTVAYLPVKLGPSIDGKRVVRSGLLAGQKIIVNGIERVRPGMPVKTEEAQTAKVEAVKLAQH